MAMTQFFSANDPFREVRRLHDEMARLIGTQRAFGASAQATKYPAINIYGGRDGIAVLVELPGVDREDLEVHAHADTLTVRGTRRAAAEKSEAFHRRERRSGSFTRTVQLPFRVDPERIEAHFENGVLRLSLPRPEEDKPRRIEIRS